MMFKCQTNVYVCWYVQSDREENTFYLVEFNAVYKQASQSKWKSSWIEGWRCECPAFQHHKSHCKHILRKFASICNWDQADGRLGGPVRNGDERLRCPVCSGDVIAYQEPLQVVDENVGF